jgi:uncharacterized membrane protein YkoI
MITASQAAAAALGASRDGHVSKVDLHEGDVRPVWEVKVIQGRLERKVEIDAVSGRVVLIKADRTNDVVTAAISAARAATLALAASPGGRVTKIELDEEPGRSVWKVDVVQGITEHEVDVNTRSGAIVPR